MDFVNFIFEVKQSQMTWGWAFEQKISNSFKCPAYAWSPSLTLPNPSQPLSSHCVMLLEPSTTICKQANQHAIQGNGTSSLKSTLILLLTLDRNQTSTHIYRWPALFGIIWIYFLLHHNNYSYCTLSDMFALPNKKAMEVVMHFLFTRLHPQLAYEEFRYPL